ncbi:MAG TPA: autotransporter outer membrane beta-barrel domain-containing protein [Candidatus Desulfofervidus auxilii]|uniref:Autotransporter outer membrane beta-barrel domain-containing protein n=1 Tax=Desulfofervidus auxilii TaxID=1621989 RepID=A0A7C0Y4A0_DESA2|nr:autotransporter outer membrane beta-barrel domain-containing protein [Candidatus Desulfofervidus auxilii]
MSNILGQGHLENNGNVTVSAIATNGSVEAYGIYIEGDVDNLANNGEIKVSGDATNGTANIYGIGIIGDVGNLTNNNTIIAKASVTNSAMVDTAVAYGIYIEGDADNLTNNEDIIANATAINDVAEAYGIYVEGDVDDLINSGNVKAISNAINGSVKAYGIQVEGVLEKISNDGNINVYVKTDFSNATIETYGLKVAGNSTGAEIINIGTISINIEAPENANSTNIKGAGIYLKDVGNVYVSNPGEIKLESTVNGTALRTLWIEGTSNVILKDNFAITFGTPGIDPSNETSNFNQRPIYVGSKATLNLNNVTLIVRMDSRNLKYETPYYLIENDNGTVNGEWGNLTKGYTNPDIKVTWYNETEKGENSAIIFSYVPVSKGSIAPLTGFVNSIITHFEISNFIYNFSPISSPIFFISKKEREPIMFASSAISDTGFSLYTSYNKSMWLMPLYTRVDADELGFDSDNYGFAIGLGGKLSDKLSADIFGGYLRGDLDYSIPGSDSEYQDVFIGGLNMIYVPYPYYFKVSISGYYAYHDYEGFTGLNYDLKETADYDSKGCEGEVTVGYFFGKQWYLIPKIGVSYAYHRTDSFWTKVSANPSLNRYYKADDINIFKGLAGLSIVGNFENKEKNTKTSIYGSIRVEQVFGDNDLSIINYVPGQPKYRLEKSISDTTVILQAGFNYKIGKRWDFGISVRGDFNGDYSAYTGKLMLRYNF